MATVVEKHAGRSGVDGDGISADLEYWVSGTTDDLQVLLDVAAFSPTFHRTLPRRAITFRQTPEREDIWDVVVQYRPISGGRSLTPPETNAVEFGFSFQAQSQHIYTSIATASTTAGAPNFKQAINVVNDGGKLRVEGVDLPVPAETFNWQFYAQNSTVTATYIENVSRLCGKVNNAAFGDYAAGELMLTRVNGTKRSDDDWQISYGMALIENRTSIDIGNSLIIASKNGHDYLWAYYQDDQDGNELVKVPNAGYVEQVRFYDDFSVLGLGL